MVNPIVAEQNYMVPELLRDIREYLFTGWLIFV